MHANANELPVEAVAPTLLRDPEEIPAAALACLWGAFVFALVALGAFASGNGPASVRLIAVSALLLAIYVQVWMVVAGSPPGRQTARRTLDLAIFIHSPMLGILLMFCALVGWVPQSYQPGWFFLAYGMFLSPVAGAMLASVREIDV